MSEYQIDRKMTEYEKKAIERLRRDYESGLLIIRVMPISRFYDFYAEQDGDPTVRAILCSSKPLRYDKLGGFSDYVFLDFDDVVDPRHPHALNCEQAADVYDFLIDVGAADIPAVDLSVCCDYGESRSAAIAAAITRFLSPDDVEDVDIYWNDPKYHPNPFVYRLVCEALGDPVPETELRALVRGNREALEKKLGKGKK